MRFFWIILFFLTSVYGIGQTTIGKKPKPEVESDLKGSKHKIMIIPFEKKMYMSQIDHRINAETKWDQKKIRAAFREGIDDELYRKLKSKHNVLSLLDDTIKYKKDIFTIYQYLSYRYDKVPDQQHYVAPKPEKEKKNINKGQLAVESNTGEHFMNARITSPSLIPSLYAKYKTDIFLFVNQVDIMAGNTLVSDVGSQNSRTITVHYTVYTVDAKEINSGTCSIKFPADVNNPSKIVSGYMSKIAQEIATRIDRALVPVSVK